MDFESFGFETDQATPVVLAVVRPGNSTVVVLHLFEYTPRSNGIETKKYMKFGLIATQKTSEQNEARPQPAWNRIM